MRRLEENAAANKTLCILSAITDERWKWQSDQN